MEIGGFALVMIVLWLLSRVFAAGRTSGAEAQRRWDEHMRSKIPGSGPE